MKKVKLFLIAAVLMGGATAFNHPYTGNEYVKVDGAYVLKTTAQATIGTCQSSSTFCTYTLIAGHSPVSDSDFTTNPNEHAMFVKY
ncbi:MAG: hypothetical protein H0W12_09370 [Chitinophagaceae bacterium]|nr:hypothetical protein [Chitinophagaceae bacterium]